VRSRLGPTAVFIGINSDLSALASAVTLPGGGNYREYLMAGIVVQTTAFTATSTAVGVAADMQIAVGMADLRRRGLDGDEPRQMAKIIADSPALRLRQDDMFHRYIEQLSDTSSNCPSCWPRRPGRVRRTPSPDWRPR
jgi:hypothetical protein